MEWITRDRPKIDRVACPWLITRVGWMARATRSTQINTAIERLSSMRVRCMLLPLEKGCIRV